MKKLAVAIAFLCSLFLVLPTQSAKAQGWPNPHGIVMIDDTNPAYPKINILAVIERQTADQEDQISYFDCNQPAVSAALRAHQQLTTVDLGSCTRIGNYPRKSFFPFVQKITLEYATQNVGKDLLPLDQKELKDFVFQTNENNPNDMIQVLNIFADKLDKLMDGEGKVLPGMKRSNQKFPYFYYILSRLGQEITNKAPPVKGTAPTNTSAPPGQKSAPARQQSDDNNN